MATQDPDFKIYSVKLPADCIIAISANTKKDLVNHFKIAPEKIKVIYLGNSLAQKDIDAQVQINSSNTPYLLYIGSRKGQHKNLKLFAQAMGQVLREEKELNIIFGGGGAFSKEEELLFDEIGIREKVSYAPIHGDQSLIALYKNAALFVYPSLYEGFGLPVLEAFSCGTPCVISEGSSIQEVGEKAAVYFNPTDTDSISSSVMNTYRNEKKQKELIQAGYERSKKFSWDIMLEETINTYKSLV
jgi:glycosyltransferase involved in cell wall biosynthesis